MSSDGRRLAQPEPKPPAKRPVEVSSDLPKNEMRFCRDDTCFGLFMSRLKDGRVTPQNMDPNTWEIYAVRYAHHERGARENFMAGDPHDDSPMPLDYYVWTLRSNGRIFVIDTGFDEGMARQRGRTFLKS